MDPKAQQIIITLLLLMSVLAVGLGMFIEYKLHAVQQLENWLARKIKKYLMG